MPEQRQARRSRSASRRSLTICFASSTARCIRRCTVSTWLHYDAQHSSHVPYFTSPFGRRYDHALSGPGGAMNTGRLKVIRDLVESARKLPASEQTAFLERECAADPALRSAVVAFLEQPSTRPSRGVEPHSAEFATTRFDVGRRLGSGGFGDVYEARDRINGSTVALQVLRRGDATSLLKFKREFRRGSQLVHRNVVRLYELVGESDHWFFTMELVHGVHLLDHLRGLPSGVADAALRNTFSQLADAVEVLHGAGIVHRDIKPSNVM